VHQLDFNKEIFISRMHGANIKIKLLYMFQAVSPPIIRSTNLYIQRQVLSKQHCSLPLSCMRWKELRSISSTIVAGSSISLFLYKALHASGGSSGHHQEHKTVHTASGTVKPILLPVTVVDEMEQPAAIVDEIELPAAIVDEMERSSISYTIAAGSSIAFTIPDAVCTVLCS